MTLEATPGTPSEKIKTVLKTDVGFWGSSWNGSWESAGFSTNGSLGQDTKGGVVGLVKRFGHCFLGGFGAATHFTVSYMYVEMKRESVLCKCSYVI